MNRFDRITAILIQLQSKKVVKAQDLADRFEVSLRTIYRDIRTLEEAGVPLFGEAGIGYSIVEGYSLPPVMFTKEEATAFVAAEKLMEKFSDAVIKKNFESLMFKVKSVLKNSSKDLMENLEDHIHVNKRQLNEEVPDNVLDVLFKAISGKKAVEMTYNALGKEHTSRLIEPIGVYHENEHWYTIGFCHLRDGYRHFRIDRIRQIALTDKDRALERSSLKEYQEQLAKNKVPFTLQKAVILVEKQTALYLKERKHYFGFVSEIDKGDQVEMTFLTQSLEDGFARWYLMFADYAEIVEPEALKLRVKALIEKISKKLN
ncbi:MAG TPA: YafY family protein [Fulvivirga sp.]|nr:YafY family protein [Fulvivirga sp.]